MRTAVTRRVSPALLRCELTYAERQSIDLAKAIEQHRRYEMCLQSFGAKIVSLEPAPDLPDAVFVEDPAVVFEEFAVIARPCLASRQPEAESVAAALAGFRPLHRIEAPAALEGGDVLQAGRTVFVGASRRTNAEGIAQLRAILEPAGYTVRVVAVHGCLHLKTACCYLGRGTILANRAWIDAAAFDGFHIIDVLEDWSANGILLDGTVLLAAGFPRTAERLEAGGWRVESLDISEFRKAEAGLTCMSLLFDG
ncbi:MAG TPA: arginine deiminase family protein [Bryobacteraceae bacterium]|nr:arginine deiminase family protein [Bryobacteraceae bacterium]